MTAGLLRALWVLASVLVAAPAHANQDLPPADGGSPDLQEVDAGPPLGAREATKSPEELSLYAKGQKDYDSDRFDEALKSFEEAYRLYRRPLYLYNIAQAHRFRNDCAAALDAYEKYLAEAPPDDRYRAQAARHRAEMSHCQAQAPRIAESRFIPPAPMQIKKRSPTAPWRRDGSLRRPIALVLLATALAGGTGAVLFARDARSRAKELSQTGLVYGRMIMEQQQRGERSQRWAISLSLASLVAAGAGAALLLIRSPDAASGAPPAGTPNVGLAWPVWTGFF